MANPRPLPTALKKANGNTGRRPLNENEPQFEPATNPAPAWLPPRAKAVWNEVGPMLRKKGVLTEADLNAFTRYCALCADWRDCYDQKKKLGTEMVIKNEEGDVTGIVPTPFVKRLKEYDTLLLKFEQEFGLTPSSRSRIVANPDTEDDLEAALA